MATPGCYAIYRLSDGFVLRTGMCEPGTEIEQVLDPATEGLVVHDYGMIQPDNWIVADGELVNTPSRAGTAAGTGTASAVSEIV